MMNSQIKQQGKVTVIEKGTIADKNLFHSVTDFSVPSNGTVHIDHLSGIQNIFIKVTGESISSISGLIKTNGTANLFLINPNGITFGKNSSLDVGGSFFATTASSVKFADGFEFSTDASSTSFSSANVPMSLIFAINTGDIQVKNNQNEIEREQKISPIFKGIKPSGLFVLPGNTLTLIGGNLNLDGATLTVEDGQIELGSVEKGSVVNLGKKNKTWSFNYDKAFLRDIKLSKRTLLDASGATGGSIQIQGARVELDSSAIRIQSLGAKEPKTLKVNASESLELSGNPASNLAISTIGLREDISLLSPKFQKLVKLMNEENFDIGKTANTVIETKNLSLKEGSSIGSITNNKTDGGKVTINTESIEICGSSPSNRSQYSRIISFTTGDIDACGNFLQGGTAGEINISTKFLTAQDGGQIAGSSIGSGTGGNLIINSSNSIKLISPQSFLGTKSFNVGNAGKVTISTAKLTARDGGRVDTSTLGAGCAGSIIIDAQSINLSGMGKALGRVVPSSITSSANTPSKITQKYFEIPAIPTGKSGNITMNVEELRIENGGELSVKNEGVGDAGTLRINSENIYLDDSGGITATSTSGKGGSIDINTTRKFIYSDSQINAISNTGINGIVKINILDVDRKN